ncbi:MAG: hypothetical protein WC055_02200 [Melioribacteraceae bacterium]
MESRKFLMRKGVRSIGQLMVANDVVKIIDEYSQHLHDRIKELEKEVEMKQKAIDALLDPKF